MEEEIWWEEARNPILCAVGQIRVVENKWKQLVDIKEEEGSPPKKESKKKKKALPPKKKKKKAILPKKKVRRKRRLSLQKRK